MTKSILLSIDLSDPESSNQALKGALSLLDDTDTPCTLFPCCHRLVWPWQRAL
jgi:hypothetical protein